MVSKHEAGPGGIWICQGVEDILAAPGEAMPFIRQELMISRVLNPLIGYEIVVFIGVYAFFFQFFVGCHSLKNSFLKMMYKKILLVEDDPLGVELTMAAFEETELAVQVAVVNDGVEAIEYLSRKGGFSARQKGNPEVVLLDLKMPRMDGLEVLEHVRNDSELNSIPIVMLSSSKEEKDRHRSYELGANAYVVKPVDFDKFKETVKQIGAFWVDVNEPPPGGGPGVSG